MFTSLGHFGFMYAALAAGLPPGVAALVIQAQIGFTILIAAIALRERPTRWQLAGVLIGAVGLLVVSVGRGGSVPLVALLLCILGALSWGTGNVVARAAGVANGFTLTVWSALVVPVPAIGLAVAMESPEAVVNALTGLGWRAALSCFHQVVLAPLLQEMLAPVAVGWVEFQVGLAPHDRRCIVSCGLVLRVVLAPAGWARWGECGRVRWLA